MNSHSLKRGLLIVGAGVLFWIITAYEILPVVLRHYEYQRGLDGRDMLTHTTLGIAADPINVGLVGTEDDIICAFHAAGWVPADPVTLKSSVKIIRSVVLDSPYQTAPVSPLYYEGRKQDLTFEKPAGVSAQTRHHIRLWHVLDQGAEDRPVWLGAATFDKGVGLSSYTYQVTHHVDAAIDDERDFIANDLAASGSVEDTYQVSGIEPTFLAFNGGGDSYFTDGEIVFSTLTTDCQAKPGLVPKTKPNAPIIESKNWLWRTLSVVLRFAYSFA